MGKPTRFLPRICFWVGPTLARRSEIPIKVRAFFSFYAVCTDVSYVRVGRSIHSYCPIYWSCYQRICIWKNFYGPLQSCCYSWISNHETYHQESTTVLIRRRNNWCPCWEFDGGSMYWNQRKLGANAPNHVFPLPVILGVEVFASALLMGLS